MARHAGGTDIDDLVGLYRELAEEQAALRPLWPYADGIDDPVDESIAALVASPEAIVLVGTIDGVVLGFLTAETTDLLTQGAGRKVGVIRLIHVTPDARGVGIGETMARNALDEMRARGIGLFDARVSPGHREAKNFFESLGFSARLIIMHSADAGVDGDE